MNRSSLALTRRAGRWSLLAALVLFLPQLAARAAEEVTTDAPLPPEEAARTMQVPEGFHVTLFAGEPDVQQPVGFCIDDRGRLWVAEAYNYPVHGERPGDRIIILEDADHDGRFDKRTVFYDGLNYVTGIEVGFGGAWVMSPPYFYFFPDRNGDDVPDEQPRVVLDGFGNHANSHNLANGFAWGPEGWLYATHGRTNWSKIGKPGTPESERVHYDGGVWRYHPIRDVWEPYADGTTNPWGIDWDDYGEPFICNCVNPHLFHVIPGAHYEPWRGREGSQYAYGRIDTIADHVHYVGTGNVRDGLGSHEEDLAGGGHAHCGTMIYLGNNWPERYRNTVFMHNIHGKRINNDILQRSGSGYVASHGQDLMRSQDPWFMGVNLAYGPDGCAYSLDWSDTGECHSTKNTHRQTGRIFRIAYEGGKERGGERESGVPPSLLPPLAPSRLNVATLSNADLVALHLHRNDWFVRHARRVLEERFAAGADLTKVRSALHAMFGQNPDVTRQLRALWTLHALGGLEDAFLVRQLDHASEYVRGWAVCLLCEDHDPPSGALMKFEVLATQDPSPLVRRQLASALQRLKFEQRWPIASALVAHAEDADDHNLPCMNWYGIEPLVTADLAKFVSLAETAAIPLVRRNIARRAASLPGTPTGLAAVVDLMAKGDDPALLSDLVQGTLSGLEGKRTVAMPTSWPKAYARLSQTSDRGLRDRTTRLALIFDDPNALSSLKRLATDAAASPDDRIQAIEALIARRPAGFGVSLLSLVNDSATRGASLRGLAEYEEPSTAAVVLAEYAAMTLADRQQALQTLASRATWGAALLDAVDAGRIPRADITAFTARQLQSLGDAKLTARVTAMWGSVRETSGERAKLIARFKKTLSAESLAQADLSAGRALYQKTCANCHKLFDAGGTIGPDITGSQRRNLDYLLENLIDPSAAVSKDYQMEILVTTSGRVVTGLVQSETDAAVTVATVTEKVVIPKEEIEQRTTSEVSMMPEGQLNTLTPNQVRDLVAYLASPQQVELPAAAR